MGFAVCIGHIAEIGGMVPGAFCGEATEIFHEGLRVPPVKIKKKGVDVDEVWKLLLANCRTPRQNYGDLRAMIGCVDLGVERIGQIVDKYGKEVFQATCEDLKDYSERRMRAELASFPDGRYPFEDVIEDDGIEARPYYVRVDVFVQGDEVVADFSRSSKQARGPINATLGVTTGAVYNALLHLTDPSIPKNSGCFRPIRVVSPPGHVTNVDYPGAARRGQHRDPPAPRQHRDRRAVRLRARARHGVRELHRHQLRVRRQPPRPRRVLRLLRHHVGRLGRPLRP